MSDIDHEPKPSDEPGITIDELAERCGVSVRAIRFYITQGLLPGPGSRGKSATYGDEHLVRLRLIRQLSERHVPLAKIQGLLQGLSLDEVRALLETEEDRSVQLMEAEQRKSPRDYVSALLDDARQARHKPLPQRQRASDISVESAQRDLMRALSPQSPIGEASSPAKGQGGIETWYRWTLAPGIELHVSAEARLRFQKLLRRLLLAANARDGDQDD